MMDGSLGGSSAPPPFLMKTYEMVDDPLTNSIVSWSQNGHSFVVWNPPEFARDLLPKYFKHSNFSSFVRQLNTYGFRKIDPDQWEFANEEFIRGQRHLLKNIYRRKPIHSHSVHNQGSSVSLTDLERQEFEEEIQRLKHDKSVLLLALQGHKQEEEGFDLLVRSLGERVRTMEHRQRQMMACLAQELQKPHFASGLMQHLELHNKKRRLLISNFLYGETNMEENQILIFQKENPDATSAPILYLELIENLESSLDLWETVLHGIAQTSSEDMYDFSVLAQPSPIIISEVRASSRDSDVDVHLGSPDSMDVHSSPELAGSSSHMGSPVISAVRLSMDVQSKSSGIDVNSEPVNFPNVNATKEQVKGTEAPSLPTGVNDVFWEQFLTETPGSSDTQEVQSERRDIDARKSESKLGDHRKYWLNMNNVDNRTDGTSQSSCRT